MAQNVRLIPCDICDTTDDVNSFCVNCKQNYCDECKKGHLRSDSSKHHKFISIGDGLLASRSQGHQCNEHNEQVLFFCKTCGKAICPVCATDEHKRHDFGMITKMVSGRREQLERSAARKESEIENVSEQISSCTVSLTRKYTENSKKNISIIKETVKDWMEVFESVKDELIKQEKREEAEGIKRNERSMSALEEKAGESIKAVHDVKVKLRTCSDAALLQQEPDISGKLAAIVVPTPSISDLSLPRIHLQQPCADALRSILDIHRPKPLQAASNVLASTMAVISSSSYTLSGSLNLPNSLRLSRSLF